MNKLKIIIPIALVGIISYVVIIHGSQKTLKQLFKSELDILRNQYGFPGATAAYVMPDGTVGVVATGLADVEAEVPMTPQSRMLAASIGKSFVAATVLALAKEDRLNLDDPVSKWLGERAWFSHVPNHSKISIRHLLTHSSGLPDHVHTKRFVQSYSQNWHKPGNPFPPEELVGFIQDQPALFEAGRGWMYTDTGYILLGLIIEAVTGHSYYKEVEQRYLKPLHLALTEASDSPALTGLAAGYTAKDNLFGLPSKTTVASGLMAWNPAVEWTGGGLISNSRDLAIWAKLLYEGHVMKADYLDDLLRSVPVGEEGSGIHYGAGVAICEKGSMGSTYGHYGVIPGYSSCVRYFPKYRVAIAFQINTDIGVSDHSTQLISDMERRLAEIVVAHVQHQCS